MVDVPHKISLLSEEQTKFSAPVHDVVLSEDKPELSIARRAAASKRSLLRSRNHGLFCQSGGNRLSSTGCLNSSPNSVNSGESQDPTSDEVKRLRPERLQLGSADIREIQPKYFRRVRNHSAPVTLKCSNDTNLDSLSSLEIICQPSLLPKSRLQTILLREADYHPNNAFLYYVDPIVEDKVDASLRNNSVHNLRSIHNAFFTLSAETFCKAVNLIDRFIVKVKVKPKYMSCVAAAAYFIAAKLSESSPELGVPNPDTLVQISRCGGNAVDLARMEEIITSKLGGDLDGVNAYDFLRLFASSALVLPDSKRSISASDYPTSTAAPAFAFTPADLVQDTEVTDEVVLDEADDDVFFADGCEAQPLLGPLTHGCSHSLPEDPRSESKSQSLVPRSRRMYDLWSAMTGRLIVALCSLDVYRYRPATLALGVLLSLRVSGVAALARICNVSMDDVRQCATLVVELYDAYYRDPHPSSRRNLVWTLSRRTLYRIGCSSPTPLDTISEDCENDKEDGLQFLFEP